MSVPSSLSDTEREVLKVLWDQGLGTVRELHTALTDQGKSWAYTTVQTLLNRLVSKGFAESDRRESAHRYRPAVSREELLQRELTGLADNYCEGTASPLVLALVEGSRFTPAEIAQFRELLDRLDGQGRSKRPGGKS